MFNFKRKLKRGCSIYEYLLISNNAFVLFLNRSHGTPTMTPGSDLCQKCMILPTLACEGDKNNLVQEMRSKQQDSPHKELSNGVSFYYLKALFSKYQEKFSQWVYCIEFFPSNSVQMPFSPHSRSGKMK